MAQASSIFGKNYTNLAQWKGDFITIAFNFIVIQISLDIINVAFI